MSGFGVAQAYVAGRPGWHPDWLVPGWQAQAVGALMTTRRGGFSQGPYESFNLRDGIGDDAVAVARNQKRLADAVGVTPIYIEQVHGAGVVRLTAADLLAGAPVHRADASLTTEPGIACLVQVADCLPVLFAAPNGRAVAAAHAGWRGLALGVLEATVARVCEAAACAPADLQAWLGAAIGPGRFEVGPDVLQAFGAEPGAGCNATFIPCAAGKWLADLPLLARDRLERAGVKNVSGGDWCTASSPSRFFSFRRDGITGRMAALVWIDAG